MAIINLDHWMFLSLDNQVGGWGPHVESATDIRVDVSHRPVKPAASDSYLTATTMGLPVTANR